MNWEILIPSIKSLIINPPPIRVWKNIFKYKYFQLKKIPIVNHSPLSLVIYVSKRCNFKCEFCFTYDDLNQSNWGEFELDESSFKKMLYSKMGKETLRVGFLGGEPFLNQNLFQLVKMAHQHGKITTIVTNASLINDKVINDLLKDYPTLLGISLYDNNSNEVEKLCKILNENKKKFWVQSVVDAENINQIISKIEFAHRNKIKNLILSNYNPSYSGLIQKVIFNDNNEFADISKKAKKLAKQYGITLTLPQTIDRKHNLRKCEMPFSYVHVDAKGNLGPCCFRAPNSKYGNIFEYESWNNSEHTALRETFLNSNLSPLTECNNCENFSRDLYGV